MRRIRFSETLRQASQGAGPELPSSRGALPLGAQGLSHGFVLGEGPDFALAPVAESFSDEVFHVAPHIFYGNLKQTLAWFARDSSGPTPASSALAEARLAEVVSRTLARRSEPSELPRAAVFGSAVAGTFLYALFCFSHRRSGVFWATAANLDYRRFLSTLSWEGWLGGFLALLDVLEMSRSHREKLARDLGRFVEQMRTMRFALPMRIPRELPRSEISRRFGMPVALLWDLWRETLALGTGGCTLSDEIVGPHFHWKSLASQADPRSFSTASDEVYPQSQGVLLHECAEALQAIIFRTVEKVAASSGVGMRYGLRDFSITCACPGRKEFTSTHHLVTPLFERDAVAVSVVRRLVEGLQGRGQGWSFHDDDGTLWRPEWMERVTVIPHSLAVQLQRPVTLFDDLGARQATRDLAFALSLRETCRASCFAVPDTLDVESHAADRPEALPLYRHQYALRPPVLLRQRGATLTRAALPARPAFLESVGGCDYFSLSFSKGGGLWVRSPIASRASAERPFEVLGLFSRHVPEGL